MIRLRTATLDHKGIDADFQVVGNCHYQSSISDSPQNDCVPVNITCTPRCLMKSMDIHSSTPHRASGLLRPVRWHRDLVPSRCLIWVRSEMLSLTLDLNVSRLGLYQCQIKCQVCDVHARAGKGRRRTTMTRSTTYRPTESSRTCVDGTHHSPTSVKQCPPPR